MRIWFDTEFIEDGRTIDLLSIGLVREDGAELYLESAEADKSRACAWVRENVLPFLSGQTCSRKDIASQIVRFAGSSPEFWADYAAYDWVALCQLYGRMVDLPEGWPMYCLDVRQLRRGVPDEVIAMPKFVGTAHNALDDARHCKAIWEFLS